MMEACFEDVSLRGRIAYGIMCAESYALAKHPERDWKPVFAEFPNPQSVAFLRFEVGVEIISTEPY